MSVKYFDKIKNKWVIFPGTVGEPGQSAYELAVQQGYKGTLNEWIESLKGKDGKSAYEIAVEGGYTGTEEEYNDALAIVAKLKDIDEVPTDNSTHLVLSGGVKKAIDDINTDLSNRITNLSNTIDSITIIDNLTTSDPNKALSANQGKILKDLIDNLSTVEFTIVDTLPSTGNNGIIYLVKKSGSSNDIYDEYIYVNGSWEKVGDTAIDLSNYYTIPQVNAIKEELENKISDNTENINDLTTIVNNITTSELVTANSLEIQKNGTKILEWNGSVKGVANIEVPNSLSDLNPTQQDIIDALGYRPADSSSAGSGDVTGPTNSIDSNIAVFSGTNGKIIKDSGYNVNSFAPKVHTHSVSDITGLGSLATKDKIDESDLNFTISGGAEVDDHLSNTSINPVQNKVIYDALSNKVDNTTLENYYLKNEVYNKSEIDNKLVDAGSGDVVAAAPFNAANRIIVSNGIGKVVKDSGILIDNLATKTYVDNKGVSWDNITNKPSSYTPSSHTHTLSEVTDAGALASKDKIDESDLNFSLPSGTAVDNELSSLSNNPVSNSVIANKFNEIEQQINSIPAGGNVDAGINWLTSGKVIIGCGNTSVAASDIDLISLATQDWVESLIFSQGFVNENTWRPIKVGDTTLNDHSTTLTINNGTGIDLEFNNGTLTITNSSLGSSYTLPIASDHTLGGIKTGYTSSSDSRVAVDTSKEGQAYIKLTNVNITAALGYTPVDSNSSLPNPESLSITANNIVTTYTGESPVNINLDGIFRKQLPILTDYADAGKPGIFFTTDGTRQVDIHPRLTKEHPDAIVIVPGTTIVHIGQEDNDFYEEQNTTALYGSIEGSYKCFCISWVAKTGSGLEDELTEQLVFINGAIYN